MPRAYVLIRTEAGMAPYVLRELRVIRGVRSAADVVGPYDVVADVEAESPADLVGRVDEVRSLEGVARLLTCPVVER